MTIIIRYNYRKIYDILEGVTTLYFFGDKPMPDKKLIEATQRIKKSLRSNSIATTFLIIGGITTFIPAFSVVGSRFDMQQFCFEPRYTENPDNYCNYQNGTVHEGLAWRVALEQEHSIEFRTKVSMLKFKPAERPYTGAIGLISAASFLSAYLLWQLGTASLSNNLFKFIREKQEGILEEVTSFKKHQTLHNQLIENEIALASRYQEQEQQHLLELTKSEGEKLYERSLGEKQYTTQEYIYELNLAKLKAQTAELKEKENKHLLESKKLESKLEDPWSENTEEEQDLETLLKEHEDGWLYDLVKGIITIIVYGRPGSAKSYTAASIALCKEYIKESKVVSLADPDFLKNKNKAWKELKIENIFGLGADWENYAEGIETAQERWKERTEKDSYITSIWDELTLMGDNIPELAKQFMPLVIATPRKCNEDVILITHSLTQRGLGGCEGMSEAIKDSCYRLKLKCNALGKPMFSGVLYGWVDSNGNEVAEKEVTIPKWFSPDKIAKMIKK